MGTAWVTIMATALSPSEPAGATLALPRTRPFPASCPSPGSGRWWGFVQTVVRAYVVTDVLDTLTTR